MGARIELTLFGGNAKDLPGTAAYPLCHPTLILHCKHYAKERKSMRKELGSALTLSKLFTTTNGKKALLSYLNKTEIATAQWLLTAGQPDP